MPEPDPPETERLGLKRGGEGGERKRERGGVKHIYIKKKKKTGETKEDERLYSR